MTDDSRRPRAFDMEPPEPAPSAKPARRGPQVLPPPEPEFTASITIVEKLADRTASRLPWGRVLAGALGGLFSLMLGLWAWQVVDALFARFTWLGWIGLALGVIAAVAALAILAREVRGVIRLRDIASLRQRIEMAGEAIGLNEARTIVHDVESLYAGRVDLAGPRSELARHRDAIMDGVDLVKLTERDLMRPLDDRATQMVAAAARRVSIVTAVSPRALIDIGFVLWENGRLIGRIAAIYGGRPGRLSFLRLARRTCEHLAVTTGIAIGDSLIQQTLGHGLTAKISARLGEGVLNGLLTTRIGIAAIEVCRPMPFKARERPAIADVAGGVLSTASVPEEKN